jgi:hypothetical protein
MASFHGFDSQQLVHFSDCLQQSSAMTAQIARANTYYLSGRREGPLAYNVTDVMAAAIKVGIVQLVEDLISVLSLEGITGACTFPAVDGASLSTVGVGYNCEDVISEVRRFPTNTSFDHTTNKTVASYWANLTASNGYGKYSHWTQYGWRSVHDGDRYLGGHRSVRRQRSRGDIQTQK